MGLASSLLRSTALSVSSPTRIACSDSDVLGDFVAPLDAACRAHCRLAAIALECLDALLCDQLASERNQEIAVHDRRAAGAAEQPAGHLERQVGTRGGKMRGGTRPPTAHPGGGFE